MKSPPYWYLLSLWLAQSYFVHGRKRIATRKLLPDILRAQCYLFLQVSIHDDLFDRQATDLSLIFTANHFRLEADEILSKHFRNTSPFWRIYQASLKETNTAIIELRALQISRMPSPEKILTLHKRICAILKVAPAALCAKAGRMKDFDRVSRFCDEMAKSGQALDDLVDIEEDLRRGELNYASSFILHADPSRNHSRKRTFGLILQAYLTSDAMALYFREIRRHLQRAFQAIKPLKLESADPYLRDSEARLKAMEKYLQRRRVRYILGSTDSHRS